MGESPPVRWNLLARKPQKVADAVLIGSPLSRFLQQCHAEFIAETSGTLANYIPELTRANPAHFGIALATLDGHVYEVGDSAVPFTIQSVSKAFVFALALEMLGAERVEATVSVEPSGEAFNSVRLNAENKPFNPMVNSGAIACSALIHEADPAGAFERIRAALSRLAGRDLDVDEAVYESERATGDRNRAIGYLLKNYNVLKGEVDAALDVYFRQCAILVTARDLAVMSATLANGGINPVTGERVFAPYAVARTLSVMTSAGMYDYAGQWIYRVGIPAKSGVGGGITAALPAQIGLGTYSPLLDSYGNSVRGVKTCEAISAHFDLHVLNRAGDVQTCISADYDFGRISRRGRQPHEQRILDAHEKSVRVLELTGTLTFANVDFIARRLQTTSLPAFIILDFRRVPLISVAAAKMMADLLDALSARGVKPVVSGIAPTSVNWSRLGPYFDKHPQLRVVPLLDEAIEWAEDQLVFRFGGFNHLNDPTDVGEQPLLADLTGSQMEELIKLGSERHFRPGERIIAADAPSTSFFFLNSGMVSVKLPNNVRLATLVPGAAFGELALIGMARSADVWADTKVVCLEIEISAFNNFRKGHPEIGEQIMRNLATLLARRLRLANTKIDLLSAN
jgi:glutaminase